VIQLKQAIIAGLLALCAGAAFAQASIPVPRDDARHQAFIERAQRGDIDLLFVGDSITELWNGYPTWRDGFEAPFHAANFGIRGDRTQDVLWRMQNGELDGFRAKAIVLLIGVNNIGASPVADIVAGEAAILAEFRKRQPQAKVLLLGIFPRGTSPDDPYRAQIRNINRELAKLANGEQVIFLDIGGKFLAPDGTLPLEIARDSVHLTRRGYDIWADAIREKVAELMR